MADGLQLISSGEFDTPPHTGAALVVPRPTLFVKQLLNDTNGLCPELYIYIAGFFGAALSRNSSENTLNKFLKTFRRYSEKFGIQIELTDLPIYERNELPLLAEFCHKKAWYYVVDCIYWIVPPNQPCPRL